MKNIALKIAIVVYSMFIFAPSFGQKNYLPAYFISLKSDTVRGFIHYANWGNNPKKISFKDNLTSEPRSINVLEIKGFSVADERYESAIVQVERSSNNTMNLERSDEFIFQKDTVFLQTMIQGDKPVYYYNKKHGKEQFYIKGDTSNFSLLLYKRYLAPDNFTKIALQRRSSTVKVIENRRYLGQLALYLKDCADIQKLLKKNKYKKKSMETLFLDYYQCTNQPITFHKKSEKTKLEFGVVAGLSIADINFKSDFANYDYLTKANYKSSTNPVVGLSLNIIFPRNRRKWSLYNDVIYTSYQFKGTYKNFVSSNQYETINTEFDYIYLKMNNMFRFTQPIGNIFFYINAGFSSSFATKSKNSYTQQYKLYTLEGAETGTALDDPKKNENGYIGGVGILYKNYTLDMRYENSDGMSSSQGLSSGTSRFYFLLGYKF